MRLCKWIILLLRFFSLEVEWVLSVVIEAFLYSCAHPFQLTFRELDGVVALKVKKHQRVRCGEAVVGPVLVQSQKKLQHSPCRISWQQDIPIRT